MTTRDAEALAAERARRSSPVAVAADLARDAMISLLQHEAARGDDPWRTLEEHDAETNKRRHYAVGTLLHAAAVCARQGIMRAANTYAASALHHIALCDATPEGAWADALAVVAGGAL